MASEVSDEDLLSWLRSADPYRFECLIADLWSNLGYDTNVLKKSNDRGIDVVVKKADPFLRTQLIQAKRYGPENKIGSQKIREYRTLYDQEPDADRVVLVSTGEYTSQAQNLAEDLGVEILDWKGLILLLRENHPELISEVKEDVADRSPNEMESDATPPGNKKSSEDSDTLTTPEDSQQGPSSHERALIEDGSSSVAETMEKYEDMIEEKEREYDEYH